MSPNIRENSEGGRTRLPSLLTGSARHGRLLRGVALVALCLAIGSAVEGQRAQRAQRRQVIHPPQQDLGRRLPNGAPERLIGPPRGGPVRPPIDKVALELLRRMIRPTTDYIGEMVTAVATQGNMPLQQTIKGDKQGRTLTTFTNGKLAGDILLVTPNEIHNYHSSTGVMDVAQWLTAWDDHESRMFAAIRSGFYSARVVGSEQVAGRQASIVELLPVAGIGEPGRAQFKFWIDTETGVQLKNEKSDAMGRVLSRRYLTSVTEGPNLLTPQDFNIGKLIGNLKRVKINPLFPENSQYRSLEQAQGHLPFAPLIPTTLPPGYALSGVWVFPGNNNQMQFVLLRFTDNVTSFSLYEHIVPNSTKAPLIPAFLHHIERWRVPTASEEIEVTYTGMLTPNQVHDLYDSLRNR